MSDVKVLQLNESTKATKKNIVLQMFVKIKFEIKHN